MLLSRGDVTVFVQRPISCVFMVLSALLLIAVTWSNLRRPPQAQAGDAAGAGGARGGTRRTCRSIPFRAGDGAQRGAARRAACSGERRRALYNAAATRRKPHARSPRAARHDPPLRNQASAGPAGRRAAARGAGSVARRARRRSPGSTSTSAASTARKADLLQVYIVDVTLADPGLEAPLLAGLAGNAHVARSPDMTYRLPARAPAVLPLRAGGGRLRPLRHLLRAAAGADGLQADRAGARQAGVRQRTRDTWGPVAQGPARPGVERAVRRGRRRHLFRRQASTARSGIRASWAAR